MIYSVEISEQAENDESGLIMEEKNLHYGGTHEPTTVRP